MLEVKVRYDGAEGKWVASSDENPYLFFVAEDREAAIEGYRSTVVNGIASDMLEGMTEPSEYVTFSHEQPRVWVLMDWDETRDGDARDGLIIGVFAHLQDAWHAGEKWIESRYADLSPDEVRMTIQEWHGYTCEAQLKYGRAGWVMESWHTDSSNDA